MKQLLQDALDAIVRWTPRVNGVHIKNTLIEKLRAAIDVPEQEPVAWINPAGTIAWSQRDMDNFDDDIRCRYSVPLYTKPQPAAELTDDEIVKIAISSRGAEPGRDGYILPFTFARAVLAAQRSK